MDARNPDTNASSAAVAGDFLEPERFRGLEHYLHSLFASNRLNLACFRRDGTVTAANRGFLQIVGYDKGHLEAGEVNCIALTSPEYQDEVQAALAEISVTGVCTPYRKEYICRNGERKMVLVMAAALDDAAGNGVAFILELPRKQESSDDALPVEPAPLEITAHAPGVPRVGRGAALVCVCLGLLGLAGWLTPAQILASFSAHFIPMAPATALCFLLLGTALWQRFNIVQGLSVKLGQGIAAGATLLLSTLILLQFFAGATNGLERLLAPDPALFGTVSTGRMSPFTAGGIAALALVLLLQVCTVRKHLRELAGWLAVFVMIESAVVLLGYTYGAPMLYGAEVIPVAFSTAIGLFVCSLGLVLANGPQAFPLRRLSGSGTQAVLLRAFLPVAPIVVLTHAVLHRILPIDNPALHSSVLVLLSGIVIGGLVLRLSHVLGRQLEAEKRKSLRAEAALREQVRQRELVNEIARAIAERQDMDSVCRVVLGRMDHELGVDFACINLFAEDGTGMELVMPSPKARAYPEALWNVLGDDADISAATEEARLSGNTLYWEDLKGQDSPIARRYAKMGLQSALLVPIIVTSNVQGMLFVARRKADAFRASERQFLTRVVEHMALAVQDANLFQHLTRANEELRQTQEAVVQQERLRALGEMASGIAHDINNALSPIVGYAELLLHTNMAQDPDTVRQLEMIMTSASDIAETIGRLRQFYRPMQPGEGFEAIDLNALAQEVIDMTRPRWKNMRQERGITIDLRTEFQDSLPKVHGNKSEIREALVNVLNNGMDALASDGTVTVRTGQTDRQIFVEIQDDGVGMDAEAQRRCLEPFYTTKGDRGTGLGLGMAFGIMQRHKGGINLDSEPGRGSTVRLHFPLRKLQPATTSEAQQAETKPIPRRILLIDDEPQVRELVRTMLEHEAHHVETAEGGLAGLDAFHQAQLDGNPFDLVITDLGMPKVGGRLVAQQIKEWSPGTPVVLLTGWGARMRAEGELPRHVDYVVPKPPTLRTLREALQHCTQK